MQLNKSAVFITLMCIGLFVVNTNNCYSDDSTVSSEYDLKMLDESAKSIKTEISKLGKLSTTSINKLESARKRMLKCSDTNKKAEEKCRNKYYDLVKCSKLIEKPEEKCQKEYLDLLNELGISEAIHLAYFFTRKVPLKTINKNNLNSLANDSLENIDDMIVCLKSDNCEYKDGSLLDSCASYGIKNNVLVEYYLDNNIEVAEYEAAVGNDLLAKACLYYHNEFEPSEKPHIKIPSSGIRNTVFEEMYLPPYTSEEFTKHCIDNMDKTEIIDKLRYISTQYDDNGGIAALGKIRKHNRELCDMGANIVCRNVDVFERTPIFSYTTIGCTARDVTKEDLIEDMKFLRTYERGGHLAMIDLLNVCSLARNYGFYWTYKKPELSNKCKSKTKKGK